MPFMSSVRENALSDSPVETEDQANEAQDGSVKDGTESVRCGKGRAKHRILLS